MKIIDKNDPRQYYKIEFPLMVNVRYNSDDLVIIQFEGRPDNLGQFTHDPGNLWEFTDEEVQELNDNAPSNS